MESKIDFNYFLSERAKRRPKASKFINFIFTTKDEWTMFGAGIPNICFNPFKSLEFSINDENNSKITLTQQELNIAQEYPRGYGYPGLLDTLRDFQSRFHGLDVNNYEKTWELFLTNGSQHSIAVIFEMMLNDGDSLLIEEPTYGAVACVSNSRDINMVALEMDDEGIIPENLVSILSNWDYKKRFPKLMYLIPVGQNPTGLIYSQKRKLEILSIAKRFNILILEDDPYYFLQFPKEGQDDLETIPLEPSFLSMDKEGRVIRLDSFSKVLAPDSMKEILDKHLGDLVQYRVPDAGMYFWLKFQDLEDSFTFIKTYMIPTQILFAPGVTFSNFRGFNQYLRASFTHISLEEMDTTIETFSKVLKQYIKDKKERNE
ncbi:hypothetical protein PPL_00573 [Heterostelium album PN500]|uniref:Aminotransferase class I/classII large domain-containing protein n=1 Tax=Heterostelium pallidum (strain ATCC 26659 / Pp 5 / PN500) TaxID=670386 RepID=D3AWU5_HETP5|nr:hypothetical protein PPL_00573 [Heterostelium album PN500]EFA86768.1 hypothetical protein PPL_00573 [Heterostelium album PN500]|eukprot:XP_020438872.1 hypothetical protein PPL_00573 [Heterostelium album PN500]